MTYNNLWKYSKLLLDAIPHRKGNGWTCIKAEVVHHYNYLNYLNNLLVIKHSMIICTWFSMKNQPSGKGGTRSPPAMPHCLQRCTACDAAPPHCLQRRAACNAAPPATPHCLQRRTACNAAPPATPHRLQRRTACKIQNGRQGAPKWQTCSVKLSTPRFLGILSNFR